MAVLTWDELEVRRGETGVDRGVLFVGVEKGVPWNGLTKVTTAPEGAEPTDVYADNIKFASMRSAENFKGTIEAVMYPDEFMQCDGTQAIVASVKGAYATGQSRVPFGLAWRTLILDSTGAEKGFKIHLAYGCTASPSSQDNTTVNDSPEFKTFSWEFTGTPVPVPERKPSAYLVFDSTVLDAEKMKKITDAVWGTEAAESKLPTPTEIAGLLK